MAYYCLHKFHWKPSDLLDMSREELAFITASIEIRAEKEKEAESKLKSTRRGK